ncbi:MAG: YciI family protein [Sandaracinaceae bacterium]|nr:YciI family protein [Sandaracinaceae bacterium]
MQYMLLIYSNEADVAKHTATQADAQAWMGAWFKYTDELKASGKLVAGDALQPTTTATSVRVRDGKTLSTDGPFAETKEQLGGYYLIDVANLDEAIAWAAKIPSSPFGTVEVRPVMTFD